MKKGQREGSERAAKQQRKGSDAAEGRQRSSGEKAAKQQQSRRERRQRSRRQRGLGQLRTCRASGWKASCSIDGPAANIPGETGRIEACRWRRRWWRRTRVNHLDPSVVPTAVAEEATEGHHCPACPALHHAHRCPRTNRAVRLMLSSQAVRQGSGSVERSSGLRAGSGVCVCVRVRAGRERCVCWGACWGRCLAHGRVHGPARLSRRT